jgi:hypothetical protein
MREPDHFQFLQCATAASPGEPDWQDRVNEEIYAAQKMDSYLSFLEGDSKTPAWVSIWPASEDGTIWEGKLRSARASYGFRLVLKPSYPYVQPAVHVNYLIDYTDRKLEDDLLGERICDMHMEQNNWWNEHCSIALYLKREVSFWFQSVLLNLKIKGWLDEIEEAWINGRPPPQ